MTHEDTLTDAFGMDELFQELDKLTGGPAAFATVDEFVAASENALRTIPALQAMFMANVGWTVAQRHQALYGERSDPEPTMHWMFDCLRLGIDPNQVPLPDLRASTPPAA